MRRYISLTTIITSALVISAIFIGALFVKTDESNGEIKDILSNCTSCDEAEVKMRGMWVSYISLDMTNTDRSENAFKEKFKKIIETAKKYFCNALFVQVRPFCDALYKSEYYPSSHILSGRQGVDAGYDALEIMCNMCHENNIKIHAWINPYRVKTQYSPSNLSSDNPYVKDKEIGICWNNSIYLNPSLEKSRELIINGVSEIVKNYEVDGIHFDDYFYPTKEKEFDEEDYLKYLSTKGSANTPLTLDQWRCNNVNLLVSETYRKIKEIDNDVVFGISPQGNINNDIEMYADVFTWCKTIGYVDYLCPQLYFSLENPALGFEDCLNQWLTIDKHANLKFYVGLGVYKSGSDADSGTWKNDNEILKKELEIINKNNLNGYILYDYEAVISNNAKEEMEAFCESVRQ